MPTTTTICGHCGARTDDGHDICETCCIPPVPRLSALAALEQTWPLAIAASRRCCLTAKDCAVLESVLARPSGPEEHVRSLLQAKLGNAQVVLTPDIDADVVTLDSRARFRVGGDPAAERVVSAWDDLQAGGAALPIATPLGASLLGMRTGEPGWVVLRDGIARSVEVERVAYQPEAARRQDRLDESRSKGGTIVPLPSRPRRAAAGQGDDDPGPSAA